MPEIKLTSQARGQQHAINLIIVVENLKISTILNFHFQKIPYIYHISFRKQEYIILKQEYIIYHMFTIYSHFSKS